MLRRALALVMVAALTGWAAPSAAKPPRAGAQPPPQSEPVDRDSDARPRVPAEQPEFAQPVMPVLQPPPPAGFMPVMSLKQKQCRAQRQCPFDPRVPCPPC